MTSEITIDRGDMTAANQGQRKGGLIEQVIAALRARITDGTWAVGTRIPTEPELVELSGAGRNTVREAVQSLVHSGLLERRQGSGTYVVSDKEIATALGRQMAGARQHDVIEVRLALEVAAARFAAVRRTQSELDTMRALMAARATARDAGHISLMVSRDLELHRAIAIASHNPVLADLYDNLIEALAENIRFNFVHPAHVDDNHAPIIEAIADGDPDAAAAEVTAYLMTMMTADVEQAGHDGLLG